MGGDSGRGTLRVVYGGGLFDRRRGVGFVHDIGRWDLTPSTAYLWTAFSFEVTAEGLRLFGSAWNSMITTLWVSAISAPLTMAVGILAAWLIARQDFVGRRAFEFGTMLSFAIPGTGRRRQLHRRVQRCPRWILPVRWLSW